MNFQLYQLLAFYLATIHQIMPFKAALLDTIAAMRDLAHRGFRQQVNNWTDKLHRAPLRIPEDLSCPSQVDDVFKQVLQVVDAFESDMNEGVHTNMANAVCMLCHVRHVSKVLGRL